jgi:type IV pilus assembly protein PilC
MPEFTYKAKNRGGRIVSGKVTATSQKSARTELYNKGLRPLAVKAVKDGKSGGGFIVRDDKGNLQIRLGPQLPTLRELAVFSKQFSLMIENGIPLLQCLKLLSQQQKKMDFKAMIENIADAVERGASLSDAMDAYPKVFDELYVALIRAGEASGHLDKILKKLVSYIEKAVKIKSQVKSAMSYPLIIIAVAVGVIALLLIWVVPTFAKQFSDAGQELPEVTQLIINLSNGLTNNWMEIVVAMTGIFFGLKRYFRTDKGRSAFDSGILKAPIIGDVMLKIAISRFCSIMSTMLLSGVSILEALNICASSAGNKKIEKMVYKIREEISRGKSFYDPVASSGIFPLMVSSMIAVGESTGTLDETLLKISDIYDDEVDTAIETMTSLIEPLLIVIIGSIVGFIVIGMYLPIFSMANTVG